MSSDLVLHNDTNPTTREGLILPAIIARAGRRAQESFLEFFFATIRNKNTREAYARAVRDFFNWCETRELDLEQISPLILSAYIESRTVSAPTIKQHLSALRMLFDYLVKNQIVPSNPALVVKGPKHSAREGKTPILSPGQVRQLIESIDTDTLAGKRDRAFIAAMLYTFARVSAVIDLSVGDYSPIGKRAGLRLLEKGGKYIVMPAHHNLEEWIDEYLASAGIAENKKSPLFPAFNERRQLTDRPLHRNDAWAMIKRRARNADIPGHLICCHSMRGTGITTFLENDGQLEQAQYMAGHADVRTTRLYDRRKQNVTQDEVERIAFW